MEDDGNHTGQEMTGSVSLLAANGDGTGGTALWALGWLGPLVERALAFGIVALYLLFLVVGLFLVYSGYGTFKQWLRIRGRPTETVSSLAQGRTDLEGRIVAGTDPVDQPFKDSECIFAIWEVAETVDEETELIASDSASTRFLLDDGTGTVLVEDPMNAYRKLQGSTTDAADREGAGAAYVNARATTAAAPHVVELSAEHTSETTVSANTEPPERLGAWCREHGLSPRSKARRTYRQRVIPVGATVYVMGATKREQGVDPDATIDDRIVGVDDASGHFLVADGSESELITRWRKRVLTTIISGLVFAALGLWLTLSWFLG